MKIVSLLTLFLMVSCFEDNRTPEAALKDFVETRMGSVITRQAILDRTTGKMRQSLENITDEQFKEFADLRNIRKESFKVLSKSCQGNKCFITYALTYQTKEDEKVVFSSEVKKIAEILLMEGKWLIADVSNIKTYHESMAPIEAME